MFISLISYKNIHWLSAISFIGLLWRPTHCHQVWWSCHDWLIVFFIPHTVIWLLNQYCMFWVSMINMIGICWMAIKYWVWHGIKEYYFDIHSCTISHNWLNGFFRTAYCCLPFNSVLHVLMFVDKCLWYILNIYEISGVKYDTNIGFTYKAVFEVYILICMI